MISDDGPMKAQQQIARLEGAVGALAEIATVREAREIHDVAAAAVLYARKAKLGIEAQNHAAEIKLRAERKAGELLALVERDKTGPRITTIDGGNSDGVQAAYEEAGITQQTGSRWQAIATLPADRFETHIAETKAADDELTTAGMLREVQRFGNVHVSHNSVENEWYTPAAIIEAARECMGGIDLDPASSEEAQQVVLASTYYTIEDDGLAQPWSGRVWMNPPYERGLVERFVSRLLSSLDVDQAVVLVNNSTETRWAQDLLSACSAVCFPAGRVRFIDPEGNQGKPLQGQMILGFGVRAGKFRSDFKGFGTVL